MDCYKTLNLLKNASVDDVRNAYLELSRLHHPDKNNGVNYFYNEISSKFLEINSAYNILRNKKTRQEYDERNYICIL